MTTPGAGAPRWRAIVADDEPPARRSLSLLLEREGDFEVVAECADGLRAIERVEALKPDLLLLDIQMPAPDGFGVLEVLGADAVPAVVFVTAYDRYALRAFEAHALDYLLKPYSDERARAVLGRVRQHLGRASADRLEDRLRDLLRDHAARTRHLVVRDAGRTYVIPWTDIDWIAAEDYCVRIHAGASKPLIRRSLQSLLDTLDPATFVRVHRSTVVNLARVREVRPLDSGDAQVRLADGTSLRVSRSFRSALEAGLRAMG
jgi:two-component system LytT family response regulator